MKKLGEKNKKKQKNYGATEESRYLRINRRVGNFTNATHHHPDFPPSLRAFTYGKPFLFLHLIQVTSFVSVSVSV